MPGADLAQVKARFSKLVRLQTKKELILKTAIASESSQDEAVTDNILAVLAALTAALPQEAGNIKQLFLKLTMGPSISLSDTKETLEQKKQKVQLTKAGRKKVNQDE